MKVALYDKTGVYIKQFESISQLSKYFEMNISTLSKSVKHGWKIQGAYYAKAFTEKYKEQIKITNYRLGKELRCYRVIRGKLQFHRKFRNIAEAASYVKMNHRTFTRRIKKGLHIEHKNKLYRFRFLDNDDITNHMHNHQTHKSSGINYGQKKVPIKLIDKHGNEFNFESIGEAVRKLDINRVAILHVLAGRQKTTFGFKVERLNPT